MIDAQPSDCARFRASLKSRAVQRLVKKYQSVVLPFVLEAEVGLVARAKFWCFSFAVVSDEREESSLKRGEDSSSETPGEHWRWCPRCGHELENHKCKLRCPRCHYFMSCSDFD